jgi:hypothetical protein
MSEESMIVQSVDLTLEQLREYIASVRWQTSKDGTHSYTLAKWKPELAAMFYAFVWFIRKNGYIEMFRDVPYICFNVDDHRYWTMGAPLHETILINRTRNPGRE